MVAESRLVVWGMFGRDGSPDSDIFLLNILIYIVLIIQIK